MTPTLSELIDLLKAKGSFWPPWMVGQDGWLTGYDPDDNLKFEDQWENWIATADASWLPALFTIALNPPIIETPYGGVKPDEWILTITEVIWAIAKTEPVTVVDKLLSAFDQNGEPEVFISFFSYISWGVRIAYNVPDGPNCSTGIALIGRMLDALAPLVALLDDKSDRFVLRLIEALGGIRGRKISEQNTSIDADCAYRLRAHNLLSQVASIISPSRAEVYQSVNDYLNPPLESAATSMRIGN